MRWGFEPAVWAMVLVAALAPGAARASETGYECAFVMPGSGGEKRHLAFGINAKGKAFTYDTKPGSDQIVRVPATVRKAGNGDYLFGYSFNAPNMDGRTGRVDLVARIPPAGGASKVTLSARGFRGNPQGPGTCKLLGNGRMP